MGYAMIDLILVCFLIHCLVCQPQLILDDGTKSYRFRIRFAYTFGDDLGKTFFMTSVATIFTLVTRSLEEEFTAIGAKDNLVELMLDEFVTIHLMHLSFALPNSALTT